ncbi:GLIPR1-like protein 1 isoform X2 [Lycorma delicatula]
MVWNDELADRAQKWANECVFEHDKEIENDHLGQNIGFQEIKSNRFVSITPEFLLICSDWYNERETYNYSPVSFYTAEGHYTQMVAERSFELGCGFAVAQTPDKIITQKYYVCNYGPEGGNLRNHYPYQKREENEPVCDKDLIESDIEGLCVLDTSPKKYPEGSDDSNMEQQTTEISTPSKSSTMDNDPKKQSINVGEKQLQQSTCKITVDPTDEDSIYVFSLMHPIRNLNPQIQKIVKIEILNNLYGAQNY